MRSPETVQLKDGREVGIRPIASDDKALLEGALERLSQESRYRRFFRPVERLSGSELAYLTEVDHSDHEALLGVDPASGEVLGVARYVRGGDPREAEPAVAVVDDWHGRGLGRLLLERLTDRAREEGIERFHAFVLADNPRAIHVLQELGAARSWREGGEVELVVELPPEEGIGSELAGLLRAAAGSLFSAGRLAEGLSERARVLYEGRTAPAELDREPRDPIVVGTDGSEVASEAVRHAARLARAFGAPLHVVAAYSRMPALRHESGRAGARPDLGWLSAPEQEADELLQRETAQLAAGGVDAATHARAGAPAGALADVAEEVGAQLIVVGSRTPEGPGRFVLGSSTWDKLAHHAPCNVLIVRTA